MTKHSVPQNSQLRTLTGQYATVSQWAQSEDKRTQEREEQRKRQERLAEVYGGESDMWA